MVNVLVPQIYMIINGIFYPLYCTIGLASKPTVCWPYLWLEKSVKIIENEVGCRDDTVPKTVETRRHCEED